MTTMLSAGSPRGTLRMPDHRACSCHLLSCGSSPSKQNAACIPLLAILSAATALFWTGKGLISLAAEVKQPRGSDCALSTVQGSPHPQHGPVTRLSRGSMQVDACTITCAQQLQRNSFWHRSGAIAGNKRKPWSLLSRCQHTQCSFSYLLKSFEVLLEQKC